MSTTDFARTWLRLFPLDTEAQECITAVFDSLFSHSGYWLYEEEFNYSLEEVTETVDGEKHTVQYTLKTPKGQHVLRREDFLHLAIEQAVTWLSDPDVGRMNRFITQPHRFLVSADFDGWACHADGEYRDLLAQMLCFECLMYS